MRLVAIPASAIDGSGQLRQIDPDWVATIAETQSIAGDPLVTMPPIEVERDGDGYRLIAGGHRVAAAREAGEETILAKVWDAGELTADDKRLMEIAENLIRRGLSVLDRAVYLATWRDIHERRAAQPPSTDALDDQSAKFALVFSEVASRTLGISRRSVFYALKIARDVCPEAKTLLALHRLADNQSELLALSNETPERQGRAARILLDYNEYACWTVAEALRVIDHVPTPKKPERWRAILERFASLEDEEMEIIFELLAERIERWQEERVIKYRGDVR